MGGAQAFVDVLRAAQTRGLLHADYVLGYAVGENHRRATAGRGFSATPAIVWEPRRCLTTHRCRAFVVWIRIGQYRVVLPEILVATQRRRAPE